MDNIFDQIIDNSKEKLIELRSELAIAFQEDEDDTYKNICVYACGSMGRLEITDKSDLDLFFIANLNDDKKFTVHNLFKYTFFSHLLEINKKLNYPAPSKQGAYWDFILKQDLLDIGSRKEDYNNSLTARMLLLLESKPVYNDDGYEKLLVDTVNRYFVDYEDFHDDFSPQFLMNDILRYWYTLTLNYEYRRDDKDSANERNWKRLKLKYARLITCFSMLACLYRERINAKYVVECAKLTPFGRLDMLAENNRDIEETVEKIKKEYVWYLNLRKEDSNWWTDANKANAFAHADNFHSLVVHDLMKALADKNPKLRAKMDTY